MIRILLISIFLLANAWSNECVKCHKEHVQSFEYSHHALALQRATPKSVLGDFNDTFLTHNSIKSRFYKNGKRFMVYTDGADSKMQDYEITYVIGLYPLQQYMIQMPKGKLQVLDIAWDARSKELGGQRWFHLHAEDNVTSNDPLHWTGPNFNWNYMCADCHSTHVKKNYDPKNKTFATTFDALSLTCASCHGDPKQHLEWINKGHYSPAPKNHGMPLSLKKQHWKIDPATHKPILDGNISRDEVEMCAQCHSRRVQLDDDYRPGKKFDKHYQVLSLEDQLYFSDGQIKDEVYEYGSFVQSKMYAQGVSCSDCHDTHSLDRTTLNDSVCFKCHTSDTYAATSHHHHQKESKGASCISCHMPSRTYMGVDERNDHSFRIPRPDLSINTDIPNACNQCHTDKSSQWASDAIKSFYGDTPKGYQHYGHTFDALRSQNDNAPRFLYDLLMSSAPSITKATAIGYLGDYPSRQTLTTAVQMLHSKEAMIRLSALRSLELFPYEFRLKYTFEMLKDTHKSVRMEASRQLSFIPRSDLGVHQLKQREKGLHEYVKFLNFNADRAEYQSALGSLYAALGENDKALIAFKESLRLNPFYAGAYINFADFYQHTEDSLGYDILCKGLKMLPDNGELHHALGLWFARNHQESKAMVSLEKAFLLDPEEPRFAYVYAIALASTDLNKAIGVLEQSCKRHSGDLPTIYALSDYYQQLGNEHTSSFYRQKAEKILTNTPATPSQH